MTAILYPFVLLLFVGALYAEFDPWFKELCIILWQAIAIELRKIPLLIRLEWDVFWMKRNKRKYLKMAEQIRKQLEDEANRK